MRKRTLAFVFLAICSVLCAQQTLDNSAIVKLVKAGLSDDLIVSTIDANPGSYDTSAEGLSALKAAGATGRVIAAIVLKSAGPAQAAPAAAPQTAPPTPPAAVPSPVSETEPKLQLYFCQFHLSGTTGGDDRVDPTVVTDVVDVKSGTVIQETIKLGSSRSEKYFEQITPEVMRSYEKEIDQSGRYKMVSSDDMAGSVHPGDGKHLLLAELAQSNHLYACLSVNPTWLNKMGWEKELAIRTTWEVVGPNGCRVKFQTSVSSEQTYGKFPYGSDPKLQSAYLDLSAQDARQLLGELQKEMRRAGCEK